MTACMLACLVYFGQVALTASNAKKQGKQAMAEEPKLGEEPEYEEALDEKPKSILMSMIRQLKTGMDLSKVSSCLNPQWSPSYTLHETHQSKPVGNDRFDLIVIKDSC